jgi:hypothetical protein
VSLIPPSRLDRRGVRVVTDVEAGCDGRDGITGRVVPRPAEPSGEAGIRGRPSRVVPIPRRWDQPLGLKSPGGTVAKKPGTPRRARSKPLKPLRREGRLSWLPCRCLRAQSALSLHARLAGAACTRPSLRPPVFRGTKRCRTRASSRENACSRLLRRHCEDGETV